MPSSLAGSLRAIGWIAAIAISAVAFPAVGWHDCRAQPLVLHAEQFGVKADGTTDDGAAIARMVHRAAEHQGPVKIVFPPKSTIRVETACDRYVFTLYGIKALTLDGEGTTFVLGPRIRFLRLGRSKDVVIRNLNVDFDPLPAAEGTVIGVDAARHLLEAKLDCPQHITARQLAGGPTKEDGEQRFFAMLWHAGPYGLLGRHYWIEKMIPHPTDSKRILVIATKEFRHFADIVPGDWQISLPVPGIAHRYGPGACFEIWDNENVVFENIELWSAPWFGFRVFRNRGTVEFRRVNIRPKPGSGRLTSTWRDGFHVKGNSASLLWEDCIVEGTNDDAFNFSTHCSRVVKVGPATKVIVQQIFPLNFMPWYPGKPILFADPKQNVVVGQAVLKQVERQNRVEPWDHTKAEPVTLVLDRLLPLTKGYIAWQPDYANPNTVVRRCRIANSCRVQTPTIFEDCDVTGLLWFYRESVEGPGPQWFTIRNSILRRGRGNDKWAVSVLGRTTSAKADSLIGRAVLENNNIYGSVAIRGADCVVLKNNRFYEPEAELLLENNVCVVRQGNQMSPTSRQGSSSADRFSLAD